MNELERVSINQFKFAMLAAFEHGREFELLESDGELSEKIEDKNLSSSGWFNKYYQYPT